jgi:hypothetical protein
MVDLNTKLKKALNGENLILRVLTWEYWNWMLNGRKPYKWGTLIGGGGGGVPVYVAIKMKLVL